MTATTDIHQRRKEEQHGDDQQQRDGRRRRLEGVGRRPTPSSGPTVFVIDTLALDMSLDNGRELRGRWLKVGVGRESTAAALRELLGRPVDGSWAIIDQIGLGPRMIPEVMTVGELDDLPRRLAEEGSA